MTIDTLKQFVNSNFTPMTWNRIELKLIPTLNGENLEDIKDVNKDLMNKIDEFLISMYDTGLSKEILNG